MWLSSPEQRSAEPDVSVVIPCFNEAQTIVEVIRGVDRVLAQNRLTYEILVMDDGSTDGTSSILKKLRLPSLYVCNHHKNRGKGVVLREGFKASRGRVVVTMDADGSHSPDDIPRVIGPILSGKTLSVIGTRFVYQNPKGLISPINYVGNALVSLLFNMITRSRIHDTQCGFRALHRESLNLLHLDAISYEVEMEILLELFKHRISTVEVPIIFKPRRYGQSHIRRMETGMGILRELLTHLV